MSFEEIQNGCHGGHLRYHDGTISAILHLYVAPTPNTKFRLNLTYYLTMIWEEMSFEEFQDGRHHGYWKGTIFSNFESLCHCDASHKVMAQSDLRFGNCRLKNFKMAAIPERNDLSNSESLFHCDASLQVSAQLDLRFGRSCLLKNFKMAAMAAILAIGTKRV